MKQTIILLAVIVLVGGVWFFAHNKAEEESVATQVENNVALMESANDREIITEDGVTYFPEASGFYAEPAEPGEYPGVVMIHENRGLRTEIKQAAEELAREGYRVLAVDLYKGTVMETQDEARAYRDVYNQEEGVENLKAAVTYLENRGAEKIASLGWCFGGRQSVELAVSGVPLDATVVYYGGGMATSTERLAPIDWPVLGIFGDQDQSIPVTMVQDFENSLNALEVENEIYVYEGVGHAFANPSNPNYSPEATSAAWERTLDFLNRHLVGT